MLNYSAIGPQENGSFLVGYVTPGCNVMTIATVCQTKQQAIAEAERLNKAQMLREKALRWDRELRGLRGDYPALEGM